MGIRNSLFFSSNYNKLFSFRKSGFFWKSLRIFLKRSIRNFSWSMKNQVFWVSIRIFSLSGKFFFKKIVKTFFGGRHKKIFLLAEKFFFRLKKFLGENLFSWVCQGAVIVVVVVVFFFEEIGFLGKYKKFFLWVENLHLWVSITIFFLWVEDWFFWASPKWVIFFV